MDKILEYKENFQYCRNLIYYYRSYLYVTFLGSFDILLFCKYIYFMYQITCDSKIELYDY